MTIRNRLLVTLLPPIGVLFLLICCFFYFAWTNDNPFGSTEWLFPLFGAAFLSLFFIFIALLFVAQSLSRPIKQLNQAALEIAAGDYKSQIEVQGPIEFVELAHTLKTMGECLIESISRVKESSVVRERMYGQYECSLLLQYYMFQKTVEDFSHPILKLKIVSVPLAPLDKGLFLKIESLDSKTLRFVLLETEDSGFGALVHLCQISAIPFESLKNHGYACCQFSFSPLTVDFQSNRLFLPLLWSVKSQAFIREIKSNQVLTNGDLVFFCNSSVVQHFGVEETLMRWLNRVLSHFADDGLDSIQTMLINELKFLEKRQHARKNFQILCIQVNNDGCKASTLS